MRRFIFAFALLIFSINTANASGLLKCCDMGKASSQTETKEISSMPHCHEMGHKQVEQSHPKDAPQKSNQCLCGNMCVTKIITPLATMVFKAISFGFPASYGENDLASSIDRRPSTPPPKI